jgi:hypothetical protein
MRPLTFLLALMLLMPRRSVAQTDRRGSDVLSSAQDALVEQLRVVHHGRPVSLPPFYRAVLATVERRLGRSWRGPAPRAILAEAVPAAVSCDGGRCDGRLESIRLVDGADSVVAVVVVLADQALLDERVWAHELTHALLMQHGLIAESVRHDPRWFPRAILAQR